MKHIFALVLVLSVGVIAHSDKTDAPESGREVVPAPSLGNSRDKGCDIGTTTVLGPGAALATVDNIVPLSSLWVSPTPDEPRTRIQVIRGLNVDVLLTTGRAMWPGHLYRRRTNVSV